MIKKLSEANLLKDCRNLWMNASLSIGYNVPRIRIEADKKAVVKDYLTTEINNNHNTDKAINRFCFYTVL